MCQNMKKPEMKKKQKTLKNEKKIKKTTRTLQIHLRDLITTRSRFRLTRGSEMASQAHYTNNI